MHARYLAFCFVAVLFGSVNALAADETAERFATGNVAVIDIDRVLREFTAYQDEIAAIQSVATAIERQYPTQEPSCGNSPLQGCDREFIKELHRGTFTSKGLDRAIEENREHVAQRRREVRERLKDLQRQRNEATIKAYGRIQSELAVLCEQRDIRLVLRSEPIRDLESFAQDMKRQDDKFLFNDDRIDITAEVINRMNRESDTPTDLP